MPINDKYNAIFVHIPKNGGTTVEYLLGMHGELETVGISPYINQVSNEFLFGAGSQEYTAKEIEQVIGHKKFSLFTSFCICRNPYSRLVSYFAWAQQYRPYATHNKLEKEKFNKLLEKMYKRYIKNGFDSLYLKPQWNYAYDENKKLLVNHIFRFEEYDKVLNFVRDLLITDINPIEKRMPSNHHAFERYLTSKNLEIINEMYAEDFELFKYSLMT
ncbi:MAG: chondroitin 4-sulfotransferase 11 [Gammaproteobacteria bacterium]|jgi:chondroitin 4-sulfotransferase 11